MERLSNLKELLAEFAAQPDTWKQMTILEAVTIIEALQQENEQLQAQVAKMREALEAILREFDDFGNRRDGVRAYEALDMAKAALSDTPAEYHNPADVALLQSQEQLIRQYCKDIVGYLVTLAKAREALKNVSFRSGLGSDEETIQEALAAIDKIGGREDV